MKVGRKKKNLMFIGDGKGKTVISGAKSVSQDLTTFHTASFGKSLMFLFSLFFFHNHLLELERNYVDHSSEDSKSNITTTIMY